MLLVDPRDPLGRRNEADEGDGAGAGVFHLGDRRNARVARRQHRVEDDGVAVGEVVGELDVVLDRLQRLLVAVEADEPDPGADTSDSTPSSIPIPPEHRADRHFLPEIRCTVVRSSGVSISTSSSESFGPRSQEERDLVRDLAEVDVRVSLSRSTKLVLDQRLLDLETVRSPVALMRRKT